MNGRSFGSLFMVASCAGAALGCYLVSLHVASERASLEDVETKIVIAQRDMRLLQTEIGTRGRLSQLERWNAGAFSLSAPSANQFVQNGFQLAQLTRPDPAEQFNAPVVMASAPAPQPTQPVAGEAVADDSATTTSALPPAQLIHQASLTTGQNPGTREVPAKTIATLPPASVTKASDKPATAAKPAVKPADKLAKSVAKPGLAAAHQTPPRVASKSEPAPAKPAAKKTVDKQAAAAAKPMTKPVRLAKADPLAPLPASSGKSKEPRTGR